MTLFRLMKTLKDYANAVLGIQKEYLRIAEADAAGKR